MSSFGSSVEDYAARRLRQIQQDINQCAFAGWAMEEEIDARKEDMVNNLREETRRAAPRQSGKPPSSSNPTLADAGTASLDSSAAIAMHASSIVSSRIQSFDRSLDGYMYVRRIYSAINVVERDRSRWI